MSDCSIEVVVCRLQCGLLRVAVCRVLFVTVRPRQEGPVGGGGTDGQRPLSPPGAATNPRDAGR